MSPKIHFPMNYNRNISGEHTKFKILKLHKMYRSLSCHVYNREQFANICCFYNSNIVFVYTFLIFTHEGTLSESFIERATISILDIGVLFYGININLQKITVYRCNSFSSEKCLDCASEKVY